MTFYLLFAIGLANSVIGMLCGVFGSAMAFRVTTMAPDTTQLLYDLIWWLFLIPWAPTMLWQVLTGFAILSEYNTGVMFPRWLGYFSLWAAAVEPFSAVSVFYYSGPFSYNGLVVFWVPGVSFFVWVSATRIRSSTRMGAGTRDTRSGPRLRKGGCAASRGWDEYRRYLNPLLTPTRAGHRRDFGSSRYLEHWSVVDRRLKSVGVQANTRPGI